MPSPHLLCELCLLRPRIPQALEMSSCPLGICPIGTSARHQTISLGCHASPPNLCTSKSYPPFKAPDPGMPHLFWEAFLDLFSHSHHLFFPSYSKCCVMLTDLGNFSGRTRTAVSVREGQGVVLMCSPPPHSPGTVGSILYCCCSLLLYARFFKIVF